MHVHKVKIETCRLQNLRSAPPDKKLQLPSGDPYVRGFQGYWLKDTVKGPQFEETKTQLLLNRKLIEESHLNMFCRRVKAASLKSPIRIRIYIYIERERDMCICIYIYIHTHMCIICMYIVPSARARLRSRPSSPPGLGGWRPLPQQRVCGL